MKVLRILATVFILGVTFAALGVAGFAVYFAYEFERESAVEEPVLVQVPRGAHIGEISDLLVRYDVLDTPYDPYIFQIAGRITGQASTLKAGEYKIPPRASIKDILNLMESGKVVQRQITLREGLTNYEILQILQAEEQLKQGEISDLPPEGHLLPETYSYAKGDHVADIITRMEIAMEDTLDALWPHRAGKLPIETREEALILASIIEKETAVPSERKKVAGVFVNRLRRGIPLQTDPTVIYAITKGKHDNAGRGPLGRRLLKKDLKYDSPYNTYLYAGLPPGPIANPGRAAIEAALHPEEHDYIYFVADGSGGHAFAKTLAEHNRNVAKWRKIRRNQ